MEVPAIAKRSFDELSNQPEYFSIVAYVIKRLKKIPHPFKRAKLVHKTVEQYNQEVFSQALVKQLSPCKLGCVACCHTQVSVTLDEAQLLAHKIENGLPIDRNRLRLQAAAGNDSETFYQIAYEERRCIFLNDQGACQVYQDRPSVCRTNAVIGSPEQCDTSTSVKPQRLIRTPKSDMVIYAHFSQSDSNGALPAMVEKILGIT